MRKRFLPKDLFTVYKEEEHYIVEEMQEGGDKMGKVFDHYSSKSLYHYCPECNRETEHIITEHGAECLEHPNDKYTVEEMEERMIHNLLTNNY